MGLLNGSTSFAVGFAAGFGTGLLTRDYLPQLKSVASPAFKLLVKSGIMISERSREGLALLGETLQDLMAEAQLELKQRRAGRQPKRKRGSAVKSHRPKKRKTRVAPVAREAEVIPLRHRNAPRVS